MVGATGVEPARISPKDPKSFASANSATRPDSLNIFAAAGTTVNTFCSRPPAPDPPLQRRGWAQLRQERHVYSHDHSRVKSEGRRPKEGRNPKLEPPSASGLGPRISELGLLSSFGLQSGAFGLNMPLLAELGGSSDLYG